MKKEIKIVRCWNVYDESNKLIFECENVKDILEKFGMSATTYLYQYKNTGKYFYTSILKNCKIRVDYVKQRVETMVVSPFIIPEKDRTPAEEFNDPTEIWKHIPETPYCNECSNKGRFRHVDSEGNYKLQKLTGSKNRTNKIYYDFYIKDPEKRGYDIRAHRAIAKTFIDPTFPLKYTKGEKLIVDHIDNNSENNNIENLRIITQAENIRSAIYDHSKEVSRPKKKCYAENIYTNERREYPSTNELVRDIWGKSNNGYFSTALKNNSVSKAGWKVGYIK